MLERNVYRDETGNYQAYLGLGIVPKSVTIEVEKTAYSCKTYGIGEVHQVKHIEEKGEEVVPLYLTVYKDTEDTYKLAKTISMSMIHTTDVNIKSRAVGSFKYNIQNYLGKLRSAEATALESIIEAKASRDWWKKLSIRLVGDVLSVAKTKSREKIAQKLYICEDRW